MLDTVRLAGLGRYKSSHCKLITTDDNLVTLKGAVVLSVFASRSCNSLQLNSMHSVRVCVFSYSGSTSSDDSCRLVEQYG